MKQKIIATGISGLVGSRIQELFNNKYEFISFSLDKGIDITNFSLLEKKFSQFPQVKTVLHLAAFTDVSRAFNENENTKGLAYKVNVIGSKNIAQLVKATNKYLIHISTDFVFDGKNPPVAGYTEVYKPKPLKNEWYGKTKYLAEKEIEKSGCKYVILRIAYPYKARISLKKLEPEPKLDLIRKIISKLKNNQDQELNMFTDQIITPTFIDDIAKVIDKCIKNKPTGIYHCVGSTNLSPYALALKIAETFKIDKNLIKKNSLKEYLKNKDNRPRQKNLSLSNKKLEKELGIKMLTIDEALRKMTV